MSVRVRVRVRVSVRVCGNRRIDTRWKKHGTKTQGGAEELRRNEDEGTERRRTYGTKTERTEQRRTYGTKTERDSKHRRTKEASKQKLEGTCQILASSKK